MPTPNAAPLLIDREYLRQVRSSGGQVVVVDVRTAEEYAAGTAEGAIHIPAADLPSKVAEFPTGALVVTVCNHGGPRSCGAAEQLRALGYPKAAALKGGVHGARDH